MANTFATYNDYRPEPAPVEFCCNECLTPCGEDDGYDTAGEFVCRECAAQTCDHCGGMPSVCEAEDCEYA